MKRTFISHGFYRKSLYRIWNSAVPGKSASGKFALELIYEEAKTVKTNFVCRYTVCDFIFSNTLYKEGKNNIGSIVSDPLAMKLLFPRILMHIKL